MSKGLQPFGGGRVERRAADLYPTHPAGSVAFMRAEGEILRTRFPVLWEPACGPGFMAKVLALHGFEVVASDAFDHGFGAAGVDFLATTEAEAPALVTNPPYDDLAEAFIRHAVMTLRLPYVAMLLKSSYWHCGRGVTLWPSVTPSVIYPLGFRLHWTDGGAPPETHSWMVWDVERPPIDGVTARLMPALPKPASWPDLGFDDYVRRIAA
ncbi:hypothetical protein [Paramagnetospirillum magneticum]|uniref:Methyltransferase n=1 Tax=Paramagnetospirillum magneticum (strain ATCC 700264 / AMB-1) TaxID=342108 RepID=Q2W756_PARM1|nr:hypothetical protein [Paramagnetospirillum magneticum]BAE50319.1 hypothetical protein amb1515 [Paramagnetospirillum magneticum AMB-1]